MVTMDKQNHLNFEVALCSHSLIAAHDPAIITIVIYCIP